jgi:hypothetical protein
MHEAAAFKIFSRLTKSGYAAIIWAISAHAQGL